MNTLPQIDKKTDIYSSGLIIMQLLDFENELFLNRGDQLRKYYLIFKNAKLNKN